MSEQKQYYTIGPVRPEKINDDPVHEITGPLMMCIESHKYVSTSLIIKQVY